MIAAAVIALLVASSHVDPTSLPSASAAASPTPMPTPTATSAPILGGITLGEDARGVLRRFNLRTMGTPSIAGIATAEHTIAQVRVFPAAYSGVVMMIVFTDKIELVMATGSSDPRGHFADPLGVRLGDSPERLVQLRGNPDEYGENGDVSYGPAHGVRWFFSVRKDKISSIGVTDAP